ncbi:MAG TPA: hypothetical protein VGP55_02090 [Chitinophagaceae bacterium]|nr:hypothetical protein [Chitinophagaceae bacterium]
MNPAGYSGTPLAKKLGIKENSTIRLVNEPPYYFDLFSDLPSTIKIIKDTNTKANIIHYFATDLKALHKDILLLRNQMEPNGMIWISWYKKSSKIATEVTEDIIREIALKNKLVDIKVCAVDEFWSALKLVIPLKERPLRANK